MLLDERRLPPDADTSPDCLSFLRRPPPQCPFSFLVEEDGSEGTIYDKAVRWLKRQKAEMVPPLPGARGSANAIGASASMIFPLRKGGAAAGGGGGEAREIRRSVARRYGAAEAKWRRFLSLLRQLISALVAGSGTESGNDDDIDLDRVRETSGGCVPL